MIVDVQLRDGNGISVMETILQRSAMPHFFMTGGMPPIFPNGATVLFKPFSLVSLVEALDRVTVQCETRAAGTMVAEPRPIPHYVDGPG